MKTTKELLIEQQTTIKTKIAELQKENLQIENWLNDLNGKNKKDDSGKKERSNSWAKNSFKILKSTKTLLKRDDVYNLMNISEPASEVENTKLAISGALSGMAKRGSIKSYHHEGIKGDFYGIPELFDGELPKEDYIKMIRK